jgi:DNA-binding response OmpR family regulator
MKPPKETPMHSLNHASTKDSPPCILVVEDDRSVATMLETAFRTWGYEVLVARDGQEGIDIVATQSVNGILVDLHMPIMDGRTMLDELRWAGYHMPVWVMSGGSDIQTLRQLLDEGAEGCFIKPFSLQSLQQAFVQIISGEP